MKFEFIAAFLQIQSTLVENHQKNPCLKGHGFFTGKRFDPTKWQRLALDVSRAAMGDECLELTPATAKSPELHKGRLRQEIRPGSMLKKTSEPHGWLYNLKNESDVIGIHTILWTNTFPGFISLAD